VKVNLLYRDIVNLCFSRAEPFEDRYRTLLCCFADLSLSDDLPNFIETSAMLSRMSMEVLEWSVFLV
jgi:hypothetical protein